MSGRHRLLYLGHNLPYPPHEGALIRSYHTVRLLSQSFDLTGLYFSRRGAVDTEEDRRQALKEMEKFGAAHCFRISQEWSRVRFVLDHARSLLFGTPYTRWVYDSPECHGLLRGILKEGRFDLVHVDSLDLLAYLPALQGSRIVLAHHNVESDLLHRRAAAVRGIKKPYMRLQARLVERAERRWCSQVDLNITVSSEDARALQRKAPRAELFVIPNGVDTRTMAPAEGEPDQGIVFVGGYSWFPNADGMEYFLREILPIVRREEPSVPVRWIGRAPEEAMDRFRAFGVQMLGYVADIRPELARARCVIVPLRVGGGTRLKILDAWAMGKAVVSTTLGCEGLEARDGENILIRDGAPAFAFATLSVLQDPRLRQRLEQGGRATAEAHYDWELLGETMTSRYRALLEQ